MGDSSTGVDQSELMRAEPESSEAPVVDGVSWREDCNELGCAC